MKRFFSSLRFRLMLLVLLALLPAFGVILYQTQLQRSSIQQRVEEQTLALAVRASKTQSDSIRESQPLLSTIAQLFAVVEIPLEEVDNAACDQFLGKILSGKSTYANLGVIAKDGTLICSALPFTAPVNLADRAYFQEAVEKKDFSIGEFQVGRVTGQASINTAMPIIDSSGQVKGVVYAALDLQSLSRLADEASLPPGTVINVLDRNGIVLMRHPNPENWIGQEHHESPVVQLSLASSGQSTTRALGLDGVERLFSFVPLVESLGQDSPIVNVGIPAAVAFAEVNTALMRNLTVLAFAGLLALVGTWITGDLLVLRRVRTLVQATERLAVGDLEARSGLAHGTGEINQLAGAFDNMAAALQERMAELQESREDLQELAEEEAVMAEIGRVISSSLDIDAVYGSFAEQVRRLVPWDRISVGLVDSEAGTLTGAYFLGISIPGREEGAVFPLPGSMTLEAIESRTGTLIQGEDADEAIRKYPNLAQSFQAGLRSFIALPLISDDEVIGVLHLQSLKANAYTDRHLKLAERVCTQISGAIAGAQLYKLRTQAEKALREAEQRVRERAAELARSNAELEQFAYIASHDLQEPLRSITGFTGLLARRYQGQLDENADRFISRINEATTRMQRLINDLLTYSRVGREIKLQPTDCHNLLGQELASMHAAIKESGAVVHCDSLPTVTADPMLLGQVFRNLLGNGIKFRREAPPAVHISAELKGDQWVFAVQDNGIGVDPQYRERIFTLFERLHSMEDYPGTGIGLSVCKKAVECWGGRIWVESEPDLGSTFYFTIPNHPEGGVNAHSVPQSRTSPDSNLMTALS